MFDFILCVSTNLFRIYLIYRFVITFLGKREVNRTVEFVAFICFYIINTVLFWEFHTVWINVLSNLLGIGFIVWLHTKTVKTILFVTSSIYLLNVVCDVMGTLLFITYKDGQVHSQIYAAISVLLIFASELITERVVTHNQDMEKIQKIPLILVPMCSIILVCLLVYCNACQEIGIAIVSMGLLLINFLMLYLYNQLLQSITQKYDMEILKQKVQIYANQLDIIMQSEEKIKTLRHDMKHHMNEIKLLANKYSMVEIQEYISCMEDYIHNPKEIISSGNMEIDSVLNYMLEKAREELETVNVNVMLPEEIKHSFDINVLLGNLLENAIEAARQTDRKYLSVNITYKKGILRIRIENSFLPESILKEEKKGIGEVYFTTKSDKEEHGIGLRSVGKIVEAYDGTMEVASQIDLFCVNLILYVPE